MLEKLKRTISSIATWIPSRKNHGLEALKEEEFSIGTCFELMIEWEDVAKGIPDSRNESIITQAMKRNGIYGYSTESLLVLENGITYYPEQLSVHWEAYISSAKFKPTTIKYLYLSGK